ncbi:MAG: hypothetical protein ACRCS6_10865 [Turicibacter sp.]
MSCLICNEVIQINRFQDLFSLKTPIICQTCDGLVKVHIKKTQHDQLMHLSLYEENPFMVSLLERIQKGDIVLQEIFYPVIKRTLLEHLNVYKEMLSIDETDLTYPPFAILVERLAYDLPKSEAGQILIISERLDKLDADKKGIWMTIF